LLAVATAVPINHEGDVLLDTEDGKSVPGVASALSDVYKAQNMGKPALVKAPAPVKVAPPNPKAVPHEHHIVNALHIVHKEKPKPPPKPKAPKKKPVVYTPATKIVAAAVHKVWSETEMKWTKDLKNKHWHCRHCHKKCKALNCHRWCHKTYCGPQYDGHITLGKYSVGKIKEPHVHDAAHLMTGNMKAAIKKVNDRLVEVDHAKHYKQFRHAEEAMEDYERARKEDMEHFKRQLTRSDDLNKAAFGGKAQRKKIKAINHLQRHLHRDARESRGKERIKKAMKVKMKDDAYTAGGKSRLSVMKMMSGGSWDKAVLEESARPTTFMKNSGKAQKPSVSPISVAATIAKLAVKVNNLKNEATRDSKRAGGVWCKLHGC